MAARGVSQFDSHTFDQMDKMPTNTLKRNPKNVDLTKTELLRLLSYLEGELQARDVSIAALKAEKAKQLMYQAKYGRFGLGDPFHALQRDSDCQKDNSFDESAVKAMYDNQLMQLENLIETQRKAQMRMREQLAAVEKRYHKVCAELEEEKKRHAKDAEEGDNVTCMLEKERERLKQELEFEKSQSKKLEKELKKTNVSTEEEKSMAGKHKEVAVKLIKERSILVEKIIMLHQRNTQLEQTLKEEQNKTKEMAEGLSSENQKSHQMEASLEKCLSDFDTEREQLKLRLSREETKNKELSIEVEKLKFQIEQLQRQTTQEKYVDGPKTIEIKSNLGNKMSSISSPIMNKTERVPSPNLTSSPSSVRSQEGQNKVFKNRPSSGSEVHNVPVVHVRNSPEGGEISTTIMQNPQVDPNTPVKRAMNLHQQDPSANKIVSNSSDSQSDRTYGVAATSAAVLSGGIAKPVPAEKPVELQGTKVNQTGSSVLSMSGGTTVFTTPSGTRISLNVGPSNATVASVSPRKSSSPAGIPAVGMPNSHTGATKGTPPPVPPNKPQVLIPPTPSSPRKDSTTGPVVIRPSLILGGNVSGGSTPVPVQHQTSKLSPKFASMPFGNPRPSGHQRDVRKPPPQNEDGENGNEQSLDSALSTSSPSTSLKPQTSPSPKSMSTQNHNQTNSTSTTLEFLGPEMDDLQQILVSMATEVDPDSSSIKDKDSPKPQNNGKSESGSSLSKSPVQPFIHSEPDPWVLTQKYLKNSDWLSLQEFLNHHKDMNINRPLEYGNTVGHFVAEKGQLDCLRLVINLGANVNCQNKLGNTLLQSAAASGHLACCKLLLEYGANMEIKNQEQLNVFHIAAKQGNVDIFELLVEYCVNNSPEALSRFLEEVDLRGNNVVYLAAMYNATSMLDVIIKHCDIDIDIPNHNGQTLVDVASFACRGVLRKQEQQKLSCSIAIDINSPSSVTSTNQQQENKSQRSPIIISYLTVSKDTSWQQLEELLGNALLSHFTNVYNGLRSKKTLLKTEAESPESQSAANLTMGLSLNSVKYFGIGIYFWSPGTPSERKPFDLLGNIQLKQISIRLFGQDDACMDNFSYESLIPLPQLHNYLRLMEQYRNVIFYGPTGSGKTFLCRKLAQIIQAKESQMGKMSEINYVAIHDRFTRSDLHSLLCQTGCLLHSSKPMTMNYTSILILDCLEKTTLADLFTDIATLLESRGPKTMVKLAFDNKPAQSYYIHSNCYILGSMNKIRLPVLDLSLQQSFRWVQFRNEQEPMRCLLHRHFYRQLLHQYSGSIPGQDDQMFKAVEWIICVWQRLNEGLLKLGLQDHLLGPATFLSCQIEFTKPKGVLRWFNNMWNQRIAPNVSKAVVQGSGSDATAGGQQKVANTALYVLIQRSVVSGCPLTGQEKERYLGSFQGSNELDIKIRREKNKSNQATNNSPNQNSSNDLKPNKLEVNTSDSFTVNIDLSPDPPDNDAVKNGTGRSNFATARNPLQKSASLPSNNILMGNNNLSLAPSSPGRGILSNPQPFSLSPKIVNTIEPKSFGNAFALSGIPTPVKQDGLRNVRSNSVSNPTGGTSSQFSRRLLAGSPLPQAGSDSGGVPQGSGIRSSGSRSATQSPLFSRFQNMPLSVPVSAQSVSTPEISNNLGNSINNRMGNIENSRGNTSSIPVAAVRPGTLNSQNNLPNFTSRIQSQGMVDAFNSQTGQGLMYGINNNNITSNSLYTGTANTALMMQRQTVVNSKAGVTTVKAFSSSDTSSLRRAFSPTPQQLSGISDIQRPDNLRRSFSPSPDVIFPRRDDRGVVPFSLPRK